MKTKRLKKQTGAGPVVVSVILPCLNEAGTLARCIENSQMAIRSLRLMGEVIVADNGSRDGSPQIARARGARVVPVPNRGYGHALRAGLAAARGRYLVIGDSDDSYDLSALAPLVEKMKEGFDMVIGNRFSGGISPGAMPWKNRLIGNPLLTGLFRLMFGIPVGDVCCGFRAMTKETLQKLDLRTGGMESAVEMIVRAGMEGCRVGEVPVTLRKDGRKRPSHLRPWRDGAATLIWMAGGWWNWKGAEKLKAHEIKIFPESKRTGGKTLQKSPLAKNLL